jgi:hypothetical protein
VPHVNDARRLRECASLLGAPPPVEVNARYSGRRPLDTTDPGQREFQALLLWCFLSPGRSLSWDTKAGRSLRDMSFYYSWVSPQRDRLVTGWTVADRVASYLLPAVTVTEEGSPGFSGIPGLRLASVTKAGVELVHLPTGGRLELRDDMRRDLQFRTSHFDSEMRRTADAGRPGNEQPLWLAPTISDEEQAGLGEWALASHAPALSAVMARIHVLWRYLDTGLELATDQATGIPRLSWGSGPPLGEVAHLLAEASSAIHVAGARQRKQGSHSVFLSVDDAAVELRGPQPASDRTVASPTGPVLRG